MNGHQQRLRLFRWGILGSTLLLGITIAETVGVPRNELIGALIPAIIAILGMGLHAYLEYSNDTEATQ